jgi:formamidopyrimidine-DNA glycosylase
VPELPEVETIRNDLVPHVVGRQFNGVRLIDDKSIQKLGSADFACGLVGQRITGLERRGKYLVFRLSGGKVLIIHLRMTGGLILNPDGDERFARVVFQFDDGSKLVFIDARRLGVMWLTDDAEAIVGKLGQEPLDEEFTEAKLAELLEKRKAPMKAILLDQEVIAGVGNMYADETLFEAKIHPLREAGSLSLKEIAALHKAIIRILLAAIVNKGASVRNYKRPDGGEGTAHYDFRVAHKRGEQCPGCGGIIERIVVRGRGTYFCPRCQKI